jgi:hypothetical protein
VLLARKIYYSAEVLLNTRYYTELDIKQILDKGIRNKEEYKQSSCNEGSSSQQQTEIIVLSDSEEDEEKSPKQKQPSESPSSKGEKRRSDQAQEDASLSKRQRSDIDPNHCQLHEQQQRKGKELDANVL